MCFKNEWIDHIPILERCPGTMGIADDVAVFGKDENERDSNLHNFVKIAQHESLVFNPDKCDNKRQTMRFFGLEFSSQGVNPDPEKIAAISQLQTPNDEVQLIIIIIYLFYIALNPCTVLSASQLKGEENSLGTQRTWHHLLLIYRSILPYSESCSWMMHNIMSSGRHPMRQHSRTLSDLYARKSHLATSALRPIHTCKSVHQAMASVLSCCKTTDRSYSHRNH